MGLTDMEQRTALVVSDPRGVGTAIAARLANDGWRVRLVVGNPQAREAAERALTDCDRARVVEKATPTSEEAGEVVSQLFYGVGRLDAAVIDVAVAPDGGLLDTGAGQFEMALQDNVQRAFVWSRGAAAAMTREGKGGSIVIVLDSLSDGDGDSNGLSLGGDASLGALERMSRAAAADLGPHGVRVNVVKAQRKSPHRRLPPIPLGRPGTADEVAAVAVFLAGPRSSFMTGVTFPVDGGVGVIR